MRRPHRLAGALVAAALATGVLAGCGDDGPGSTPPGAQSWEVPADPVADDVVLGEASVSGTEVTLADGTVIDVGTPIDTFVVAGDGVYALPQGPEGDDDPQELLRATPDVVEGTGVWPDRQSLSTSPDGRFLGLLDYGADAYAEPAEAVVVDLAQGTEVVRSSDGMGEPDFPDLEALYAETGPTVLAVTADHAYVATTGPVYSYTLPDGEQEREADSADEIADLDWVEEIAASEGRATQQWRDGEPEE